MSTLRVLVVEDDADAAELYRVTLEGPARCAVTIVGTMADAESRLAVCAYDLVISDYRLPDSEPQVTPTRIRRAAGKTAVVMIGASPSAVALQAGTDAGVLDQWSKSDVGPERLMALVDQLIPHDVAEWMIDRIPSGVALFEVPSGDWRRVTPLWVNRPMRGRFGVEDQHVGAPWSETFDLADVAARGWRPLGDLLVEAQRTGEETQGVIEVGGLILMIRLFPVGHSSRVMATFDDVTRIFDSFERAKENSGTRVASSTSRTVLTARAADFLGAGSRSVRRRSDAVRRSSAGEVPVTSSREANVMRWVRIVAAALLTLMVVVRAAAGIDAPAGVAPLIGGPLVIGSLLATNVLSRRLGSAGWSASRVANLEVAADIWTVTVLLWVLAPVASPQILPIGHLMAAMEAGTRVLRRDALALAGTALIFPVLLLRQLGVAPWMTPSETESLVGNAAFIIVIPALLGFLHALMDGRRAAEARADDQQRQLEASLAALQDRNTELDRFAERVAHDLRGPLSVINGSLELLALDRLDETNRPKVLAATHSASDRMNDMIGALLAHTRAVGTAITATRVSVEDLVREAIIASAVDGTAVERRGMALTVSCTPPLIVQALQNLFSNAVKYAAADRDLRILVSARCDGDVVTIEVADNGIGVEPADRDRLLGHGEQADPGNPGFGIGLSTVASVVRRHGGEVHLDRSPFGGLLVRLTLPA